MEFLRQGGLSHRRGVLMGALTIATKRVHFYSVYASWLYQYSTL